MLTISTPESVIVVPGVACERRDDCTACAQLTFRESLRDIAACLRSQAEQLDHMAIRGWRIYADFAQRLIGIARQLYADEPFGVDLSNTAYALDSTTIDLWLSLFPWRRFRTTKAAVRIHALLDLRGNIPSFVHISDGKLHDINILDQLIPEAGAFYVMDRGYIDFARRCRLHQAGSFFVTRAKKNMVAQRRYSRPAERAAGAADLRSLQGTLAGGAVLSLDQAAPADQGFLRYLRECREVPDLNRRVGLRARRHHQEAAQPDAQPLRNPTDSQPQPVACTFRWMDVPQARALAGHILDLKENHGCGAERLGPLLAGLAELLPYLTQWYEEPDPAMGERMGGYFEASFKTRSGRWV